jgi:uncharacterized delta-60 repeat protein
VTDLIVARYNASGNLDTSFGHDGYFHLSDNSTVAYIAKSVAQLPDGKLVIGGLFGDAGVILMLDTNGKLYSGFDSDGIKLFSAAQSGFEIAINSIAIDNNGQIVFAGHKRDFSSDATNAYLGRLNTDGTFDSTLGGGSEVVVDLGSQETLNKITILSDNSIIAVGSKYANSQTPDNKVLIVKYTNTGALDSSGFNAPNGYQSLDANTSVNDNSDILYDVEVNTNGMIYASGSSNSATATLTVAISLNANGTINTQFAASGIYTTNFGSSKSAHSLALDSNGNLLLTGTQQNGTDANVFITRVTPQGISDTLFNKGNPFTFDITQVDMAQLIIKLTSGAILIGGHNQITPYNAQVWYLSKFNLVQ